MPFRRPAVRNAHGFFQERPRLGGLVRLAEHPAECGEGWDERRVAGRQRR